MELYMKIIDKETKRESNLIPIEDAIFNQDGVEFEFGEYDDDFRLNSNNETVKVKINITRISKHVPILNIDDTDEMEE